MAAETLKKKPCLQRDQLINRRLVLYTKMKTYLYTKIEFIMYRQTLYIDTKAHLYKHILPFWLFRWLITQFVQDPDCG